MRVLEGQPDGRGLAVAMIASRFNQEVVDRLVAGARRRLLECGVEEERLELIWVPGAVELPLALAQLLARGGVDAVVALGAVVRGETPHFDYVAAIASQGISELARRQRVAVSFGVLTVESISQALDRTGGRRGDKGAEAAESALRMCSLMRQLGEGSG